MFWGHNVIGICVCNLKTCSESDKWYIHLPLLHSRLLNVFKEIVYISLISNQFSRKKKIKACSDLSFLKMFSIKMLLWPSLILQRLILHYGREHQFLCDVLLICAMSSKKKSVQMTEKLFPSLKGSKDSSCYEWLHMSRVKRICVFEHSVMTNFNCACPAIQKGQGSGFLSEGYSWFSACMSEQRRFWRDCADAQACLNLRCSHRR